jgi:hypothetical protein
MSQKLYSKNRYSTSANFACRTAKLPQNFVVRHAFIRKRKTRQAQDSSRKQKPTLEMSFFRHERPNTKTIEYQHGRIDSSPQHCTSGRLRGLVHPRAAQPQKNRIAPVLLEHHERHTRHLCPQFRERPDCWRWSTRNALRARVPAGVCRTWGSVHPWLAARRLHVAHPDQPAQNPARHGAGHGMVLCSHPGIHLLLV